MQIAARSIPFDGGQAVATTRTVAVEAPVAITYGTVPYAVMMMTPANVEDFAIGFSLTEGVAEGRDDIRSIEVIDESDGLRATVGLAPDSFHRLLARRRSMRGRTSCGVCGVEDLGDLPRSARRTAQGLEPGPQAIERALAALPGLQALNKTVRALHAAAWSDVAGTIACVREDVGRHNALDKLIGALLDQGVDPSAGFVLITSRCSYEMVEKAAAFGAGALVAISAPTSLSIERARHHGIALFAAAGADAVTQFSNGAEA